MLFDPFQMRDMTLPNRIVVSPMAQYSANEHGEAGDWHLMHIGSLAVSGPSLIILEATAVEPRGRVSPHCLGLWADQQVAGLKRVVDFCRANSPVKLGIQLAHAGRKASVKTPWQGGRDLAVTEGGWPLVGACEAPYPGRPLPEALDAAGMSRMTQNYVDAAVRADQAGFDLIELHCAHGYLLNTFLSPLSNKRKDAYGATLENRMRYPLQVFEAIRRVWPDHKPLGVRISATDWVDGGWGKDDSVRFAQELLAQGCDYVAASSGGISPDQKIEVGPGYQVEYASDLRRRTGMPTIAVGHIWDPGHADDILTKGDADLIALGRGMTYNPRWAWHAAEAAGANIAFPPQYARSHPSMRQLPR